MKSGDISLKREQLNRAIAAQENLRGTLDDAIIDATIDALSKQLAELDQAPVVEQKRKLVTVLFMDIVNSTRLMLELDPEENLDIMDAALQKLAVPVTTHGGRVTRFMGDGYMAVFGLPHARENEPEMAVRAGLGILLTAQTIAQELDHRDIKGFQVRVGVNTGLVVAGGVTEAESTMMGTAVNIAARLEELAPPGGLLISQYTYQHVRGLFDLEPGELVTMKGFPEPVQVYLVKNAKPRAFRLKTRGVEGIETHMIGREEELNFLMETLRHIVQIRKGRFVTVVGEAGLGKSRLLDEFESWLDQQPVNCILFKGRATLETLDLPYGLLRDLMASRFGILDDDPIPVVRKKVVDGFRDALGKGKNLEMNAHFVGHLLGYDFRDSPYLQGVLDDPRQIHNRATVYLSTYFSALASNDPVVIFLDDIHWADESSLDILLHLGQVLSAWRVLIITLSRPSLFERRPSWDNQDFHQRLDLHPLSRKDSQHLVLDVLQRVQDIPDTLSDLIVNNAEGNPYYIEELIKMLVEDGVIIKGERVWLIKADRLDQIRIPPTLTGVVQARLDSLPLKERLVMQQASVVGRIFWDATIMYMNTYLPSTQAGARLESLDIPLNLGKLQHREMVFQRESSAFSDTSEYFFKHTILREVTYESVLKRVRRMYHASVADWLITQSGERSGEVTGLIAGHLEKAGKKGEALEYMCRAADLAASNYAIDEASEFLARALALTPEDDLERRYSLLIAREKVLGMQGNRSLQQEVIETLSSLADTLVDERKQAEVLIKRSMYAYWISEYPQALASAQQAITLAEAAEDQNLAGQAYYALAWAYLHQGDNENASNYGKHALSLARQVGDLRIEGNTLNILGLINIGKGGYFTARGYLEEFLGIAREIGDRDREITALNNLSVVLIPLGDYQTAQDYLQQILSFAREMGDQSTVSTALVNLAWVTSAKGDWEPAIKYAQDGIAMKREFGHKEAIAEGLVWMGHARLGLGQPQKATEAYREALEIRQGLNLPHHVIEVLAGIARAAMELGDVPIAQGHVEEILTYLYEGGTLHGIWEPLRIYLTCYQVLHWVKDQRADQILEVAFNLLQQRSAQIPVEEDRHRYLENVSWHRELVTIWATRQA